MSNLLVPLFVVSVVLNVFLFLLLLFTFWQWKKTLDAMQQTSSWLQEIWSEK